jgi:hypothetical protein
MAARLCRGLQKGLTQYIVFCIQFATKHGAQLSGRVPSGRVGQVSHVDSLLRTSREIYLEAED